MVSIIYCLPVVCLDFLDVKLAKMIKNLPSKLGLTQEQIAAKVCDVLDREPLGEQPGHSLAAGHAAD